jgi:hypothetical protein
MAVEYGKYADINEGQLSSDASDLIAKLSPARSDLNHLRDSLTDDIWKAGAKATLLTAFNTLDSDVYANLLSDLEKINSIAGHIGKYKTAETNAKTQKGIIDQANQNISDALNATPPQSTTRYEAIKTRAEGLLANYEAEMQDEIDQVNQLNS